MRRKFIRQFLVGGAAAAMLATPTVAMATPASAVSPRPPKIKAHPDNSMVNTFTTLTGSGFSPNATLRLTECSTTNWAVGAQSPCNANNTVTLTTGATGEFTTKFQADVCPNGKRVGPTAVRCYIGVPKPSGIDTMTLEAAAKITVTYP
jgi:Neocarzinostatin family